ncbi:MAG: aldo/keto reductase [Clostridia bacterium]|nr:aldo/keto reductase [Clostridia bacterium]
MKKLGFGLMRLPKEQEQIAIERSAQMANRFLERGYTYFDTAYVYNGSEVAFRKAVAERHQRSEYLLANKLPVWCMKCAEDAQKIFDTSLERCGVDYFDYYMLHSITDDKVEDLYKYDCWNFCRKLKSEGKIRNFGISFHGSPQVLEQLLSDNTDLDFVQLQINYLDWDNGVIASGKCYEICRRHNKPIIIMEPVKGGTLASLKPEAAALLDDTRSPASYALRFVMGLEGVMMVLSGMSDEAQMEENLATFDAAEPLTEQEQDTLKKVANVLLDSPVVGCTACGYCVKGCPMEIPIPKIFSAYNREILSSDGKAKYNKVTENKNSASACIACGACETACPQHLPIVDTLKKASEIFE